METNRIDFEQALNAEQLAAVQAPDGPVLVIAAAGTGKTRTLIYRVAWLVERGIDPTNILLLTFTNRAAREMLDRARTLVGDSVSGLWGGTFHHMANRILRRHADALNYRNDYTILDQDDARSLIRTCLQELQLKDKDFPKPDVLLNIFSLAANTERPVEDFAVARFEYTTIDIGDILAVHRAYEERKRTLNAMDFDDLLVNGLRLFQQHEGLLERYRERFVHTLVDEYQDTNIIQASWVDLIAGPGGNLLVVGDDFQSIYSWRGADFRNIISFPDRYPGTHMYKLVTNYRSVPEILGMANACIAGNTEQFQKTLKAVRPAYQRPVLAQLRDGRAQSEYIVNRVRALRREGYQMSEIAVLYRSHFHTMELQMELAHQSMPYVITSGVRFFEQAHIKDVTALLRLLHNPADELAFQRLLGLLPRLGPKTALKIWKALGQRCDLRKAATRARLLTSIPKLAQEGWRAIDKIAAEVDADQLLADPGEIVHRFTRTYYGQFAEKNFDNAARRIEDIDELINYTARFESVEDFLNEVALLTNLDAEAEPKSDESTEVLRLSTVHQAKGLEWRVVFILWMAESMFPSGRSISEDESDSEERRLFYVALTRAKDELHLCLPRMRRQRDGGCQFLTPSRFIEELAPNLMRRV
jgi:DNA helicase II / ATP-dependent DNA helicase PcrA